MSKTEFEKSESVKAAREVRAVPRLPGFMRRCLHLVPRPLRQKILETSLNRVFADALAEGELDFLRERWLAVKVLDADVVFALTLNSDALHGDRIEIRLEQVEGDMVIEGCTYAFMLLASRREDADTLFFRRQLKACGDTELGLYIKNFLDAFDVNALPGYIRMDAICNWNLLLADCSQDVKVALDRCQHRWQDFSARTQV
ncbi:MAG TPA: lipid carrier protein [Gammaproteobacteria bacterium]|nr:lipid carrier protein [Gammaproteobacteria bacterium]